MNAFIKALKEAGRILVLAVVSYLLTGVVLANLVASLSGNHLDINTQLIVTGVITTILKSLDTWLHEQGKATNNPTMTTGLTRF